MRMSGQGSSCGACKFLRRKCTSACLLAPHFSYEQGATHFAAIHKVFGASNVSKLLSHLPPQNRSEAAISISYEAQARIQDPIYGCVAHIFALQQQVANLQEEIDLLATQMMFPATSDGASCTSLQAMNSTLSFQFSSEKEDGMTLGESFCQHGPEQSLFPETFNGDWSYYDEINQEGAPMNEAAGMDRWEEGSVFRINEDAEQQSSLEKFAVGMMGQDIWPTGLMYENAIYPGC